MCPEDPRPPSTPTGCLSSAGRTCPPPEAPSWPGRLHHTRERGWELPLPHLLPDAAQVVRLPAGQALQQELPTVMPRRPLQLGSLLGCPPAPGPPAPKPGPETA